ncbi:hypothetical protein ASPWEDRAFT_106714 [Aspergillus wentii DTO 134E9]|uniref:Zn(2)-C6 fungal-type domain-containing protein n=1 Tax=Aspergillus wentii DTO 134E9 TaxID=1073089 RepID=A0A1L9RNB2_ASPWE|nr:uncharacterized protein ASPWEDRAFT_106714 [Aspergillus wentii DTO 134E9]OJJ36327.1 hypothetical protein ASPWEDRAFT_106714 [Aspergillus wentii DTO 134E9]
MDGSCYTCRRRRIQCDRSQIPCGKCEKAGIECYDKRPLRWVKGVAIRGNLQGVSFEAGSGTVAKTSNSLMTRNGKLAECMLNGPAMTMQLVLEDPSMANLDGVSRYYLDYYNDRICKLFIVYDSDKNPFRSLIPLALNDGILLKALLALAACHKANTGRPFYHTEESNSLESFNALRDTLAFKHQAIQGLSRTLQDAQVAKQDTTVASIFLLIFLDLLESGRDRWNVHLEGAKNLIALNNQPSESPAGIGPDPGRTVQDIRNFITRQIYLIETLGSTFVRPGLLSQVISPGQLWMMPQENVEQSFLGCPEYILNAIQYLSQQRDIILSLNPVDVAGIDYHIQNLTTVLESIQNFDCYAWASTLPQPQSSSVRDTHHLGLLSQSYKTGALVYGRRVLDILTQDVISQDDLISELINLIGALKDDNALYKCVLWPIVMIGFECQWQSQRDFVTGCLERFWTDTSCLNAINAAKVLQTYWQQGDTQEPFSSQWIFNIGCFGGDWLLI